MFVFSQRFLTAQRLPARIITDVATASAALRRGQLVAIPTETVYGLGGNALDGGAAAAIFAAKDRPRFDPLIIHQSSAERLFAYAAEIPEVARTLADRFWPGPLTLVLPKAESIPDLVTSGLPTVAMRVPDHPMTLRLLAALPFPVAAPSANPFGYVSPTRAEHVADQLGERIPYILDGGPCGVGLESTIVAFAGGRPVVLRKGGLAIESLETVVGHSLTVEDQGNSRPAAPGTLSSHYSPGIELELLAAGRITALPPGAALVVFGEFDEHEYRKNHPGVAVYNLSARANTAEAARRLFGVLRSLAGGGYVKGAVQLLPEEGLGRAVNDRLRRAAFRAAS